MKFKNALAGFLLVTGLFLCLPMHTYSQYWSTLLDSGADGTDLVAAADHQGAYTALTGTATSARGVTTAFTTLISSSGDTLWTRTVSGIHDVRGIDVAITPDHGVLVACATWTPQSWRSSLVKYDSDGSIAWELPIDVGSQAMQLYPIALDLLPDGTSVLLCQDALSRSGTSYLVATAFGGSPFWHTAESNALLADMFIDNGNIYVVGSIAGSPGRDMFAARYKASGPRDAFVTIDAAAGMDDALSVVTAVGDVLYAGGRIPDANGDVLLTMLRWPVGGNASFHTLHSTYGAHRCTDIRAVHGAGIALTARVENAQGGMGALIGMYDAAGTLLWSDTRDGSGSGDVTPPRFAGCSGGFAEGSDTLRIEWAPALDDVSMPDEILYSVYAATASGAQNFTAADIHTQGSPNAPLSGLTPNTTYYIVVRAADIAGNRDGNTREILLTTGGESLRIVTKALLDGTEGQPYSATLQAEGGQSPYHWEQTAGALPPGIVLDTTGLLSGTPTTPGSYTFTVTVTDALNATASEEYTVNIAEPALRIVTDMLPDAQVCQPYLFTLRAQGGQTPYMWAIIGGDFPNGFQLSDDGALSGETHIPGSHTFTVGVEDANRQTDTKELTLTIASGPRLHVTGDMTLPGGMHCFSTLYVNPGARLVFEGPASIRCTDSLVVLGELVADCADLTFLDYHVALIRGRIDNRCVTGDSTLGGSLFFYSDHGEVSIEMGSQTSGIFSHGGLHMTDDTTIAEWETVVTPDARSTTPLDPVAALTADVLNDVVAPGEGVSVSFLCEGADPDGGPVTFAIDFGDGETRDDLIPDVGPGLDVEKRYSVPGSYLVTLTVEDDEGRSTGATARIVIGDSLSDGSEGLGACISPDWLLVPKKDSVYFALDEGTGPVTSLASVLWDFGDGNTSNAVNPVHLYAQAGRYPVTCTATDDSGNTAMTQCSVSIYTPDTNAVRTPPPGAPSIGGVAPQAQRTVNVDAPVHVTRRIVYRGYQHMRIGPNAAVTTRNGRDGIPGIAGGSGRGLSVYSPGWLIINGSNIAAGSGGAGASNSPNGSSGTKGGKGGSLYVQGRNVWIGGGTTLSGGDGGNGGDVSVSVPAEGTARAFAKRGGDAAGRVRIQASNSLTFGGPVTIHTGNGGNGGNATATGGPGQNRCPTGQNGANALARAGGGGKAGKRHTVRGNISGLNNVTVTGGQGGNGGTAIASAGRGGNAECDNFARGGKGGWAKAFGGDGGSSGQTGTAAAGGENFKPGKGGDASATPGDGGHGIAHPNPAVGKDGCPGENGGDAEAYGGNGGDGLAVSGKKGRLTGRGQDADPGTATVNGADGGSGIATGGRGGNGTTCDCDGGNGGKADAHGGFRGKTEARGQSGGTAVVNEADDGTAYAQGGAGGNGGHCCTPPAPVGGDGGNGGDAVASAGPNNGIGDALGGNGGDGGDGKGPGAGGAGGNATRNAPRGQEIDGADGADGEWCFIFDSWYIYFSTIPDGTISPGSDQVLGTYTDKDLGTQIGQVTVHFMSQSEAGIPQLVGYFKAGPQVFLEAGGFSIDMGTLTDVVEPTRNWYNTEFSMNFQNNGTTPGMMTMVGYQNNTVIASREVFIDPAVPNYSAAIAAPQGQQFDEVTVVTDVPVTYNHWEIEIIVFDP
ncbi:MAG: PKD domain-containing protein [Bacteroidetes bacterium]|nr:PKD domain-containing protein [Bacteroidota bacterium]